MRKRVIPIQWTRHVALGGLLMAFAVPVAADAERLEADLRALFAGQPEALSLGEVSEDSQGEQTRVQNLEYLNQQGERVQVEQYIVEGAYEAPDRVILEGLSVADGQGDQADTITARRLLFIDPSRALLLNRNLLIDDLQATEVTVEELAIASHGRSVLDEAAEPPLRVTNPRLTVDRLHIQDLTPTRAGRLEASNMAGNGEAFGDIGDVEFSLSALTVEGLHDLDSQTETRADNVELQGLDIQAQRLAATLEHLMFDTDMTDGAGSLRLEALDIDLARMLELAPVEERTRLRMISNVLTGGSGRLMLDAALDGKWKSLGDSQAMLNGESQVTVEDAFRWTFTSETPARLPQGADPASYLANVDGLDDVTLLGGEVETTLTDLGLFERLPAVVAASEGRSEADILAQARTQAKGVGSMLGPEFAALFGGLVDMLEGKASELIVNFTLPKGNGQELDTLANDPLVLPSRLSMKVQTRE